MRVVVVGAGGHGQVVADVLLSSRRQGSEWEPVGYVDDNPALIGCELLGLPVLGLVESLGLLPHDGVVVAIGDNDRRRSVFSLLEQRGERFVIARHPSTVVALDVMLGDGSMVCAGVVINTGSEIGCHVILNTGCTVDHHARIGDCAHIAPGVNLGGNVTVGPRVLVGLGAAVLPGVSIGPDAIVGAGAVVTRDVPAGATVVGVPARQI